LPARTTLTFPLSHGQPTHPASTPLAARETDAALIRVLRSPKNRLEKRPKPRNFCSLSILKPAARQFQTPLNGTTAGANEEWFPLPEQPGLPNSNIYSS